MLLPLVAPPASAGLATIRTIVGKIGDFDRNIVTVEDAQGVRWEVDREAFLPDFQLRPGKRVTIRVSEGHLRKASKTGIHN